LTSANPTPTADIRHDLDPYFEYLERTHERASWYTVQLGDVNAFIDLFLEVVQHFATETIDDGILTFSDNLLPRINAKLSQHAHFSSEEFLEIVLHQIGLWLLMEECFPKDGFRTRWMEAYCQKFPTTTQDVLKGKIGLRELLNNGGLLPLTTAVTESTPRQGIPRDELKAYTLTKLGGVSLRWSMDITEHLKIKNEQEKTTITISALPCVLAKHYTLGLRYVFAPA
jgi:hypothetical protein